MPASMASPSRFARRPFSVKAKAARPFGLGFASVLKGEESLDGKDPAYFAITILSFREEQGARDGAASDGAKALINDIANFTSAKPVVQFNTAVP
jgi:hypothetical protein